MPIDLNKEIYIMMSFPIKDLQLTQPQLALLDEEDLERLSEIVFSTLIDKVVDFHGTIRRAIEQLLQEKRNGLN